jgi:hypothetical protein
MALGPRPGQKRRSGVVRPHQDIKVHPTDPDSGGLHDDVDNSGNETPAIRSQLDLRDVQMVDLDD